MHIKNISFSDKIRLYKQKTGFKSTFRSGSCLTSLFLFSCSSYIFSSCYVCFFLSLFIYKFMSLSSSSSWLTSRSCFRSRNPSDFRSCSSSLFCSLLGHILAAVLFLLPVPVRGCRKSLTYMLSGSLECCFNGLFPMRLVVCYCENLTCYILQKEKIIIFSEEFLHEILWCELCVAVKKQWWCSVHMMTVNQEAGLSEHVKPVSHISINNFLQLTTITQSEELFVVWYHF